jgi:predicted component of type VI protein secretion system
MTKLLQEAIEKVRELPEREQDQAAQALLGFAESHRANWQLTEEQAAEVRRRLENPSKKTIPADEVFKSFRV